MVKTGEELFEIKRNFYNLQLDRVNNFIDKYTSKITSLDPESHSYARVQQEIKTYEAKREELKGNLEFARIPNEKDSSNRIDIMKEFPKQIKDSIPDGCPIVFHGNDNIGKVREILKSGGLLTPEQRGVNYTSFATQIDVTSKNDIRVSCEYAEPGVDSCLPYGAIFAFMPEKVEEEKVLKSKGSEVEQGVNGVNFREEPDRLISIITTLENISTIKQWCGEYGIPSNKVHTHEAFLEEVNDLINGKTEPSKVENLDKGFLKDQQKELFPDEYSNKEISIDNNIDEPQQENEEEEEEGFGLKFNADHN